MIILAGLAICFAIGAAITGFNGTSVISLLIAIALIIAKFAP
jgi:hypothetical protein